MVLETSLYQNVLLASLISTAARLLFDYNIKALHLPTSQLHQSLLAAGILLCSPDARVSMTWTAAH
jgi:hypothetical protein